MEIQQEITRQNETVPNDRLMEWRIGVNLGEIVEEEGRIYGDGVNIAARIESLAEAGSICISGAVHDQVKNKLDFDFEYQGEQLVKNIPDPVRIYRIVSKSEKVATAQKPLPVWKEEAAFTQKPSIAVLPFDNMSGDPEQEYFSDGMTEEIITRLARNPMLSVIARNSTFTYKGQPVKIQQIGAELGVKYVVEGSVRKAGNMVRITAQLIDTTTGGHLWGQTYDRELTDIFSLQDDIAEQIVVSLISAGGSGGEIVSAEQARVRHIPTENLTAYDAFLRGWEHFSRLIGEEDSKARVMFEKAIEMDPDFALAYVTLAAVHLREYVEGRDKDPQKLELIFEYAKKAVSLNDSSSLSYVILSYYYRETDQLEQAIAHAEKGISLNPNDPHSYLSLGNSFTSSGRPAEAVEVIQKAMQLDPHHGAYYGTDLARAYRWLGNFDKAIDCLKEAQIRNPNYSRIYLDLSQIYRDLGRYEESIKTLKQALSLDPDLGEAIRGLSLNYRMGWLTTVIRDRFVLDRALEIALKMVTLDDSSAEGHFELSVTRLYKKQADKALVEAEKVIDIDPEYAEGYLLLADIFNFMGKPKEAIKMMQKAMSFSSTYPASYLRTHGFAYYLAGREDEAEETLKRVFSLSPNHESATLAHLILAIIYSESGRENDAQNEANEVLKLVPEFSLDLWEQRIPMAEQDKIDRAIAALRRAGLD